MVKNFKTLEIWKKSRMLVKELYDELSYFPGDEKFGITAQMKRAAISIPSNIAEGCGRGTTKELNHFLNISIGSNCELETQIYLANDLGFLSDEKAAYYSDQLTQIRRMTLGLIKTL